MTERHVTIKNLTRIKLITHSNIIRNTISIMGIGNNVDSILIIETS